MLRAGVRASGSPRTSWRWLVSSGALTASLIGVLTHLALDTQTGIYQPTPPIGAALIGYGLLGIGFAVWAARHRRLDRQTRRAWLLAAVSYVLLTAQGALRPMVPINVFPNAADALRLAFVPVMAAALLWLPLRAQSRKDRQKVWLDTGIVVIASSMALWYLDIRPGMAASGRIPLAVLAGAIAYPTLDLMLIFGITVVLLRGAAASARRPALLLGGAMMALVAGDVYLSYQQSHHGSSAPDRAQYFFFLTGHFLLAMAAFAQCWEARHHSLVEEEAIARQASMLPYVAIGAGYILLLVTLRGAPLQILGLVVGAMAMTGVVVGRQIIAMRENLDMAITDTLTGLVNRRRLYDALRLALARSARNGQVVAALLIDMNGFKKVNDTMGHEAGDDMLVEFAALLKRAVLGGDVVARLGGDEFAVVLHNITRPDNAVAVVQRILAEMQTPVMIADTLVTLKASIGVAVAQPGEKTVDELLHHADLAMYRAKKLKAISPSGYEVYDPAIDTDAADETKATADDR